MARAILGRRDFCRWIRTCGIRSARGVRVWDPRTGLETSGLPVQGEISHLAISPSGKFTFLADTQGRARLWNRETGEMHDLYMNIVGSRRTHRVQKRLLI